MFNSGKIQNKFENIKLIVIIIKIMVPLQDGTRHDMQLLKITLTIDQTVH